MNNQERFLSAVSVLKLIGFQGEVSVTGGIVLVNAFDKPSASLIRKALKKTKSASDCQIKETRGVNCSVFTIILNNTIRLPIQKAA